MLGLVLMVLFLIAMVCKKKYSWYKVILTICMYIFVIQCVLLLAVVRNDNGYVQQQIDLVIEENCELERLEKMTEYTKIQAYLRARIEYNEKELKKCFKFQERVPFYRWLLYFKY